jgi:hypothetical protein
LFPDRHGYGFESRRRGQIQPGRTANTPADFVTVHRNHQRGFDPESGGDDPTELELGQKFRTHCVVKTGDSLRNEKLDD